MASASQSPVTYGRETSRWGELLKLTEMWASLTIITMWLAVLVAAVWGPSIVSNDAGGSSTSVPSAVPLALFAFLGTWLVSRYAFRRDRD